jgi:hypothetical protein
MPESTGHLRRTRANFPEGERMSSFYIGYLPQAPDDLRKFLRGIVTLLASVAVALAIILVLAQQNFSPAFFEFTKVRDFTGTLQANPYPTLLVIDPTSQAPTQYLLAAVGKHGFTERLTELSGKPVHLRAKLIYRNEGAMLEVVPNTIGLNSVTDSSTAPTSTEQGEDVALTGEIVDTKCFLGVMNPGRTKVHRDCAARCLSGGIPPALLVQDGTSSNLYLLAASDGAKLDPQQFLTHVGEPVTVRGKLFRSNASLKLNVSQITPN